MTMAVEPGAGDMMEPESPLPAEAAGDASAATPEIEYAGIGGLWIVAALAVIVWAFVIAFGFVGSIWVAGALIAFFVTLAAGTIFALSRL